jgi:hypothetical protein
MATASMPMMEYLALRQSRFADIETLWRVARDFKVSDESDFAKLHLLSEVAKQHRGLDSEWIAENSRKILEAANTWKQSALSLEARYALAEGLARIDGGHEIQRLLGQPLGSSLNEKDLRAHAEIVLLETYGRLADAYSKVVSLEETTDSLLLANRRARLLRRMHRCSE